MKQFRLLEMALLALIMSVGFVACSSSDDDDPVKDFTSIVTEGVWAQNGDDDIFIFSKDGSWFTYESPKSYLAKTQDGYFGTWSFKDSIFTIKTLGYFNEDGTKEYCKPNEIKEELYLLINLTNKEIKLKLCNDEHQYWIWLQLK